MGLRNSPADSKGLVALTGTQFSLTPIGIGQAQLTNDEQCIVNALSSVEALVGPLVPSVTPGQAAITVPTTLNDLWVNLAVNGPGNDANDGRTQATPFASIAKALSVLGNEPVFGANFTLHVDGANLPTMTENLVLDWTAGKAGIVLAVDFTETNSGAAKVLTGVTNRVQAANTRQAMTDGATNWAANLKKIIRDDTVGARFGTKSFLMSNDGGGAATVGTWLLTNETTISTAPTETLPIAGDSIQVVDSFPVTGDIAITLHGVEALNAKFFLRGAHLSCNASCSIISDGLRAYLVDCVQDCSMFLENVQTINVVWAVTDQVVFSSTGVAGGMVIYGGGYVTGVPLTIAGGVHLTMDLGFAGMNIGTIVSGNGTEVTIKDAAFYDWAGGAVTPAIEVTQGGYVFAANAAALWGSSAVAAAFILRVRAASTFRVSAATTWVLGLPITATTADIQTNTGILGVPFNLGTRVYDAFAAITKASLDGTFPNASYIDPLTGNNLISA